MSGVVGPVSFRWEVRARISGWAFDGILPIENIPIRLPGDIVLPNRTQSSGEGPPSEVLLPIIEIDSSILVSIIVKIHHTTFHSGSIRWGL